MYPELVDALTKIAIEELEHFNMVIDKIRERGMELQYEQKDSYEESLQNISFTAVDLGQINLSIDFFSQQ